MSTVGEALALAAPRGVARLDAQLLLGWVLARSRAWLIAHDDAAMDDAALERYEQALRRRADGEPLAYIVGTKEFHGLTLAVDHHVLVPRPDTETLVDWAIELLSGELSARQAPRVVDLGTGSGAIALAVKQSCAQAEVCATDTSEAALAVARRNAASLGLSISWHRGRWWNALWPSDRFDLALSNPPYIAEGDPHLAGLAHEPTTALVSGREGLDDLRQIVTRAPQHLAAGGWLLLEHGHDQAEAVSALLRAAGFDRVQSRKDLAGLWRCTGGQIATSVTASRR